jgi:hypothetical protein
MSDRTELMVPGDSQLLLSRLHGLQPASEEPVGMGIGRKRRRMAAIADPRPAGPSPRPISFRARRTATKPRLTVRTIAPGDPL